jgi:hypothetical protein
LELEEKAEKENQENEQSGKYTSYLFKAKLINYNRARIP